jgi:hypothetical protein
MTGTSFLDALKQAASDAETAEAVFRREVATRIKLLEQERAFAFRRLNFMRAVAGVIASAEGEEIAVANALAVLREKLGWGTDSDARSAVLTRFAVVAQAAFASLAPPEAEAQEADVGKALAEFEAWYAQNHPTSFWVLFEQHVAEFPVVDF